MHLVFYISAKDYNLLKRTEFPNVVKTLKVTFCFENVNELKYLNNIWGIDFIWKVYYHIMITKVTLLSENQQKKNTENKLWPRTTQLPSAFFSTF